MNDILKNILTELKIPGVVKTAIEEAVSYKKLELIPDEKDKLLLKFSDDVAYEFYCCDIFNESTFLKPVSFLDICYSPYERNSLGIAKDLSYRALRKIKNNDFDCDSSEDIRDLVCYICNQINNLEFSKYKTIADIDKEIPIEVFISVFNNQKDSYKIVFDDSDTRMAGILEEIIIRRNMMGVSFRAKISIMSRNINGEFVNGTHFITINPKSYMVKTLKDMGIEILTKKEKDILTERGKKYLKITEKPYYCKYSGYGYTQGWMEDNRISINSRVMIDINAMTYLNSDIDFDWYYGRTAYKDNGASQEQLKEDSLWMLSPVVYGFSFGNKEWCKMSVDNIEDIVFAESAFKDLIIPQNNKDLFVACMTHNMPSLDDIEDKGAGKIFLLYGPAGVGKTMTAEATAEHLHKPLYFVSVGELGTDPQELEGALERVMTIASKWDAIILLDEVDVFAIKREGASIERNAMTAIFLRTLERYSGIMFMTTNLLDNLDPAFISRATAVIEYKELDVEEKKAIWTRVIEKAEKLNEITVHKDVYENITNLAENYNINGRVIKNTVRLAYTLALSKDKVLRASDILAALSVRKVL